MMVDGRFLKITGRIKELYKLENGKYITPVPLEDSICRSQFILQCMVYGANRPFNVALVVPDFVQALLLDQLLVRAPLMSSLRSLGCGMGEEDSWCEWSGSLLCRSQTTILPKRNCDQALQF